MALFLCHQVWSSERLDINLMDTMKAGQMESGLICYKKHHHRELPKQQGISVGLGATVAWVAANSNANEVTALVAFSLIG